MPGERNFVPLPVRDLKLRYAKDLFAYMTGDSFTSDPDRDKWKQDVKRALLSESP